MALQRNGTRQFFRPALLAGLVVFLALAFAVPAAGSEQTANASGSVFRFALPADPSSLEPGLSIMLFDSQVALNLHVGLFRYDASSHLVPYLVKRWSLSPNGLTYTFALRSDARWPDGTPITASDVKAIWERDLDPKVAAWGAGYIKSIAGAQELLAGQVTSLSGVVVVDDHTLRVTLSHADPAFLDRLGATPTWIVPPSALVPHSPTWQAGPVGAGPFQLQSWQHNVSLTLTPNPTFFGPQPGVSSVEYLIVPDETTQLNMYKAGQLDAVQVPSAALPAVRKDPTLSKQLHFFPQAQLNFVGMNMTKVAAFRDVRVRRAFIEAVDRPTITSKVLFGEWTAATSFITPGVPGYSPSLTTPYAPKAAQALFAAAGYPNGHGFPHLLFATLPGTSMVAAEAMAAQLRENLGVNLTVQQEQPAEFFAGVSSRKKFDMFFGGWTADYNSAEQWLYNLLDSKASTDFSGYRNAHFNALVARAQRTVNDSARAKIWAQANRFALDDAAMIPFAYGRWIYLVKPYVSGLAANIFEPIGFAGIQIHP